jgi:peptidylprolyl isomerase
METEETTKTTVEEGQFVKVHYIGTLDDGTEFDNSYQRQETLDFQVGNPSLLTAFNGALVGMAAGEKKTFAIEPTEAYGVRDEEATVTVGRDAFPENFEFNPGDTVEGQTADGTPVMAKIISAIENDIQLDLNHPLAGQTLNFEVELVEVQQ